MTLYQELLKVSQSMLSMGQQEDWDNFYKMEKERELIIHQLKHNNCQGDNTINDIQQLISIHKELENLACQQKDTIKKSLLDLQKAKKASSFYQK